MSRTVIVKANDLEKSIEAKSILVSKLNKHGIKVVEKYDKDAELVISIGGDGTFLSAIKEYRFKNIPLIGINTGHLGFLTEMTADNIDNLIDKYLKNDYSIEEVSLLEAKICRVDKCKDVYALNEIVVKSDKSRVLHLDIEVNNKYMQKFSGDGIIVSTSTGSTAYNYSAGGCIVDTELDIIQMTPMYPMNTASYRSLTSGAVFSNTAHISIKPEYRFEDSILVVVDGVEYRYEQIVDIKLSLSKQKVKLLRVSEVGFWEKVTNKFL